MNSVVVTIEELFYEMKLNIYLNIPLYIGLGCKSGFFPPIVNQLNSKWCTEYVNIHTGIVFVIEVFVFAGGLNQFRGGSCSSFFALNLRVQPSGFNCSLYL